MKFTTTIAFATLIFCIAPLRADPAPSTIPATTQPVASAEVVSVQITRPMSADLIRATSPQRRGTYMTGERYTGGTELIVVVRVQDRLIIAAGDDALQVTTFVDDKYNDMGRTKRDQRNYSSSQQMNIVEGGKGAVFVVSSDHVPVPDAARILMRGTVSLKTIRGMKTSERQKLALRVGKSINVGPVPLTIRSLSESGSRLSISFSADGSTEQIRAVRFYGVDGKEITAAMTGRSDFSNQGTRTQSSLNYSLPETLEEVGVEVEAAEATEAISIPLEVQADVGVAATGRPSVVPPGNEASSAKPGKASSRARTSLGSKAFAARPVAPEEVTAPVTPSTFPTTRPVWPARAMNDFPTTREAIKWPTAEPVILPTTRPAFSSATIEASGPSFNSRVDLLSIFVGKLPPEEFRSKWGTRPELLFRPDGGAVVRLMLSVDDRTVMDVDMSSVQIDEFLDNTGHHLSKAIASIGGPRYPYAPWSQAVIVSADGHHAVFPVNLADTPPAGSTRFALHGSVEVQIAKSKQIVEHKDFSFVVGNKLRVGDADLTIQSLRADPPPNGDPTSQTISVYLSSLRPPETIRSIDVIDSDGQLVPTSIVVANTSPDVGVNGKRHFFTLHLAHDVSRGTVRVTFFDGVELARVPFQVASGIGLD